MGQPVVHFEIMGTDSKKLREYYSELFGWEIDGSNDMEYGIVNRDDNLSAEGTLGCARLMGPDQVPGGPTIGLFRDPQGNTVGVLH